MLKRHKTLQFQRCIMINQDNVHHQKYHIIASKNYQPAKSILMKNNTKPVSGCFILIKATLYYGTTNFSKTTIKFKPPLIVIKLVKIPRK